MQGLHLLLILSLVLVVLTEIFKLSSKIRSIFDNSKSNQYDEIHDMAVVNDMFTPISTSSPLPQFVIHADHPVPQKSFTPSSRTSPIPTNKFYANLFLGSQSSGVWLHPFSVWWSKGDSGVLQSWGLSVAHIDGDQKAYGPDPSADPVQYYINPIGIQSFTFSATEFSAAHSYISLDSPTQFSVNLSLHASTASPSQRLTFPLVQGSGFITGIYRDLTPKFESGVFFRSVRQELFPSPGVSKWKVILEDGKTWLLYAHGDNGQILNLTLVSNSRIQAAGRFTGVIQVTKIPGDAAGFEPGIDSCAGAWPDTVAISASVSGAAGSYTLTFQRSGYSSPAPLLMYALPHHMQSFDTRTAVRVQVGLRLQSTTKGLMTAVVADSWTMNEEELPVDISFSPSVTGGWYLTDSAQEVIRRAAVEEMKQDPSQQSDLDSMYFSGKALDKFATLCWAVWDALKDKEMTIGMLERVKVAFSRFATNAQKFPLAYDGVWKGIVSSAIYANGDLMSDFGNGCYNDHHFHYGYFIHTAAIIARLDVELGNDRSWLDSNRLYVDNLARDAANPSDQDPYFPVSRAFDWFHGHSWAKGLFESADGKDQESTSEDSYFSYALKLWGSVTGDTAMEARGNLMLAVQRRVFRNYFLMENANANQPPKFIRNKVAGILFENKCDHATYFGTETQYIQGIHMIPVSPIAPYIRSAGFVREEWERYFSEGRADQCGGGWKGIVYSNYAIVDPNAAWEFFARPDFKSEWLDGGATRTWYLVLAAGWAGDV